MRFPDSFFPPPEDGPPWTLGGSYAPDPDPEPEPALTATELLAAAELAHSIIYYGLVTPQDSPVTFCLVDYR